MIENFCADKMYELAKRHRNNKKTIKAKNILINIKRKIMEEAPKGIFWYKTTLNKEASETVVQELKRLNFKVKETPNGDETIITIYWDFL